MSDPPLSDIDLKYKMTWVWTTLYRCDVFWQFLAIFGQMSHLLTIIYMAPDGIIGRKPGATNRPSKNCSAAEANF